MNRGVEEYQPPTQSGHPGWNPGQARQASPTRKQVLGHYRRSLPWCPQWRTQPWLTGSSPLHSSSPPARAQAQAEWPRGQGAVGAQQTGGASLWAMAGRAITHPSFPKPSPHPSGTQWPHIPPAPLNWPLHLWGRQAPSCPGGQVCRRLTSCSSTLPQFPRLLGDPAPLSKSAGCPRAFPHAGAGRKPPSASARGQGHPPAFSPRALPRQTLLALKLRNSCAAPRAGAL